MSPFLKIGLAVGVGFGLWKLIEHVALEYGPPNNPNVPGAAPSAKNAEKPAPRPSDLPLPQEPMPAQITTNPVPLVNQKVYFVGLTVQGFFASLVTPAQIADIAQTQGFSDIVVNTEKPANWPGQAPATYYVQGRFTAPSRVQSKSVAPGVTIGDVYQA